MSNRAFQQGDLRYADKWSQYYFIDINHPHLFGSTIVVCVGGSSAITALTSGLSLHLAGMMFVTKCECFFSSIS